MIFEEQCFSHEHHFAMSVHLRLLFCGLIIVGVFYSICQDIVLVCRLGLCGWCVCGPVAVDGGGDWDSWSRPSVAHTCVCLDTHACSCMRVWLRLLIRSRSLCSWINTLGFVFALAFRLRSELLLQYQMQIKRRQCHSLKIQIKRFCFYHFEHQQIN